jgi:Flp pilus assembly protein TadG
LRHRTNSDQEGAAAVEFAIILPLLVLLIFGTIEFSLLLFNKQVITNAAREGARKAIIAQSPRVSDSEIINTINAYCKNQLITFGDASTALEVPIIIRAGTSFGDNVEVVVRYNYDFLVLANLGFNPLKLESTVTMKME